MKREIKFRAFDLIINQMFVPSMINQNGDVRHIGEYKTDGHVHGKINDKFDTWLLREVEGSFELMQFTGLHDKNGKEIYEGDILLVDERRLRKDQLIPMPEFKGYVKYEVQAAQYWIMTKRHGQKEKYVELHSGGQYGDENGIKLTSATVIGNIYEDQILLK